MKIFRPSMSITEFDQISAKQLKQEGIKLILFDFDNTLARHRSSKLTKKASDYLLSLKSERIQVYIISNAKKKRITPVLDSLGLDGRGMSYKPLPLFINKTIKSMGIKKNETILIGDQIFTDVLAGNLAGIRSVYIKRISDDESASIRFKRKFEKFILGEGKGK